MLLSGYGSMSDDDEKGEDVTEPQPSSAAEGNAVVLGTPHSRLTLLSLFYKFILLKKFIADGFEKVVRALCLLIARRQALTLLEFALPQPSSTSPSKGLFFNSF